MNRKARIGWHTICGQVSPRLKNFNPFYALAKDTVGDLFGKPSPLHIAKETDIYSVNFILNGF
jgi:hypothetical protein